jgi:exodeoxyribonuclease VII small subunit
VSKKKPESVDFEQAMADLEGIVARLEQGELSLDESLRQFERGVGLTRNCHDALKTAEQRVEVLSRRGTQTEVTDFSPTDDDPGA